MPVDQFERLNHKRGMSSALLAPVMTITFFAPPPPPSAPTTFTDVAIALHEESRFPLPPRPPPCLRRKMVSDSNLDGSLETADPRKALAGAHMRSSGAASNTRGKGLGHAKGIYVQGGVRRRKNCDVAVIWRTGYQVWP